MQSDYRARFFEIAKDGEARTSAEVADMLSISVSGAIGFLYRFKVDLAIRSSGWKLIKEGDSQLTKWRLERR